MQSPVHRCHPAPVPGAGLPTTQNTALLSMNRNRRRGRVVTNSPATHQSPSRVHSELETDRRQMMTKGETVYHRQVSSWNVISQGTVSKTAASSRLGLDTLVGTRTFQTRPLTLSHGCLIAWVSALSLHDVPWICLVLRGVIDACLLWYQESYSWMRLYDQYCVRLLNWFFRSKNYNFSLSPHADPMCKFCLFRNKTKQK